MEGLLAMSDAERNQFLAEIERQSPQERLAQSRPLNAKERADWNAFRKRALRRRGAGRPKIGKGSAVVSLSVEKDLLKQADAYAKAHGMKRSELLTQGLRTILGLKAAG
jgi:hypothetical protein